MDASHVFWVIARCESKFVLCYLKRTRDSEQCSEPEEQGRFATQSVVCHITDSRANRFPLSYTILHCSNRRTSEQFFAGRPSPPYSHGFSRLGQSLSARTHRKGIYIHLQHSVPKQRQFINERPTPFRPKTPKQRKNRCHCHDRDSSRQRCKGVRLSDGMSSSDFPLSSAYSTSSASSMFRSS